MKYVYVALHRDEVVAVASKPKRLRKPINAHWRRTNPDLGRLRWRKDDWHPRWAGGHTTYIIEKHGVL